MTEAEKLAERLKVAEEMWCAKSPPVTEIRLHDVFVEYTGNSMRSWKVGCNRPSIVSTEPQCGDSMFDAMIDCILAARAKLREEAEAALPEEAKRWRDKLLKAKEFALKKSIRMCTDEPYFLVKDWEEFLGILES